MPAGCPRSQKTAAVLPAAVLAVCRSPCSQKLLCCCCVAVVLQQRCCADCGLSSTHDLFHQQPVRRPVWQRLAISYNPWTGTIHMWPGPVQGNRPGTPVASSGPIRPMAQTRPMVQPHALAAWPASRPLPPHGPPPASWFPLGGWATPGLQAPPFDAYGPGALGPPQVPQPGPAPPTPLGPWNQQELVAAFSTVTLQPPATPSAWYMDSGATSHMASISGILSHSQTPTSSTPSSIIVGDGSHLPITGTGFAFLRNLHLANVLVSPHIIKNLVSIRQFTIDNHCSVEFDPFGFSVKDLKTRSLIARCNSSGPLYPLNLPTPPAAPASSLLVEASPQLWHCRLRYIGHESLSHLISSSSITCN
jgi:hypothetical protein